MPFHLGQDVTGVMSRYRPWKKTPSTEFLGLDEGILRLSIIEIRGFNKQNKQNKSQGGENIQMALKKTIRHFCETTKGIKGTWSRRKPDLMKTFGSCNFSNKHRSARREERLENVN